MQYPITRRRLSTIILGAFVWGFLRPARLFADAPATQPAVNGLALWMSGQKDAAVDAFIACDWSNGAFVAADPVMNLSELEFLAKSRDSYTVKRELEDKADALVEYIDAVIARGESLGTAGKADDSRKAYSSVKQCGLWLVSRPDRIHLLFLIGQQTIKSGDGGLFKEQQTKPS